jgi:hypothetical protein
MRNSKQFKAVQRPIVDVAPSAATIHSPPPPDTSNKRKRSYWGHASEDIDSDSTLTLNLVPTDAPVPRSIPPVGDWTAPSTLAGSKDMKKGGMSVSLPSAKRARPMSAVWES